MDKFISPTKGALDFSDMVNHIIDYISSEKDKKYAVFIGTDSSVKHHIEYVTAIAVHRVGYGGIFFYTRKHLIKTSITLRERIYQETLLSVEIAQKLLESLDYRQISNFQLTIHLDIGKNGPTKEIINEVMGIVKGYGFEATYKPLSWAATSIADRYT